LKILDNGNFRKWLKGICASQAAKGNPLAMHKQLREATCDAQAAKGNLRKLIKSSFSERPANYEVFCAMNIKVLSSINKITTA
jgi:hypothetical protein